MRLLTVRIGFCAGKGEHWTLVGCCCCWAGLLQTYTRLIVKERKILMEEQGQDSGYGRCCHAGWGGLKTLQWRICWEKSLAHDWQNKWLIYRQNGQVLWKLLWRDTPLRLNIWCLTFDEARSLSLYWLCCHFISFCLLLLMFEQKFICFQVFMLI